MAKKPKSMNRPGTISPASQEQAARFMDDTLKAWRKYRAEQDAKESKRKRRKFLPSQPTLF